jgi:hypothetical protein
VTDTNPDFTMTPQEQALTNALHRMRHEHGDLWPPEPGCGCGDWAVALVRNLREDDWHLHRIIATRAERALTDAILVSDD